MQPTKFFDFNKSKVKQRALDITENFDSDKEKAKALFYWVRDTIKYNMQLFVPIIVNNFKASKVMQKRQGFCVSKSILLSTLARAVGIPARIHLVDLINHLVSQKVIDFMGTDVMFYHGFSEFFLDNKWVKLTPSFDQDTAIRGGFLPMVEFDGNNDAVFPPYDINGKKFGEYVGDRGVHADLPLDEIDKVFREKYEMYRMFLNGSVKLDDNGKLI
ncbi:MAG: transglutaminase family protein [Promethearchaeota archaeon]